MISPQIFATIGYDSQYAHFTDVEAESQRGRGGCWPQAITAWVCCDLKPMLHQSSFFVVLAAWKLRAETSSASRFSLPHLAGSTLSRFVLRYL